MAPVSHGASNGPAGAVACLLSACAGASAASQAPPHREVPQGTLVLGAAPLCDYRARGRAEHGSEERGAALRQVYFLMPCHSPQPHRPRGGEHGGKGSKCRALGAGGFPEAEFVGAAVSALPRSAGLLPFSAGEHTTYCVHM